MKVNSISIDIPGTCQCWHDGYTASAADEEFNHTKSDESKVKGNRYEAGFNAVKK